MTEQEWEDKLDEVQKHSENWYNKWKQAEEKIADIKANCDLAIEGRDIKIKELEQENAELKDDNKVMADNYSKMEQKFYDNLTKAKELLKRCYENYIYLEPLRSEINQFLKEIEK